MEKQVIHSPLDDIIHSGRKLDTFSFSTEAGGLYRKNLGSHEVRVSSNGVKKISEKQVFAMALDLGGDISSISLNASAMDRYGVRSFDVKLGKDAPTSEKPADNQEVVAIEQFGHSRLTACPGTNVFILENPNRSGHVDITEMDMASELIAEYGLEITSQTPISTFVQSDKLNVRSWAIVVK